MSLTDYIIGIGLTFMGGTVVWGRDVERRIAATEAVADKLNELIQLLLADRLNNGQDQERGHSSQFGDSRGNR